MKQTHNYTGSHYVSDNGFPLTWIFKIFTKRATSRIADEAEEHHERHRTVRSGKIIGRVAGPEAYTGKSASIRTKEQAIEGNADKKQRTSAA